MGEQNLILSLLQPGKTLSTLYRDVNKEKKDLDDESSEKIINSTKEALKIIVNRNSTQLPYTFDESKIIPKILTKLKDILDGFSKFDPDKGSKFQDLKKEIDDLYRSVESSKTSASDTQRANDGDHPPREREDDHREIEDDTAYNSLEEKARDCLLFCGELLSYYKNDRHKKYKAGLSKRELIHWWIGLDLIQNPVEGEQVVAKLVEKGLIYSSAFGSMSRKFNTGYIENAHIPSKVKEEKKITTLESSTDKTLVLVYKERKDDGKNVKAEKRMVMVINKSVSTLNADKLDDIDTGILKDMKVEILHLGQWPYSPKKYVVFEDIEHLMSFMNRPYCQHLTTLSLQGVGGIVDLPDSVYKIGTIKVLDLKACPNLETLPEGISSLKNLTSIDVSECYLLGYIPKGIGSLSKLMVIKGFIINSKKRQTQECGFEELEKLENLIKLAVRSRKTFFPKNEDLKTISKMQKLRKLKITWVQQTSSGDDDSTKNEYGSALQGSFEGSENNNNNNNPISKLPRTLKKLELIAAPQNMGLVLLDLISFTNSNCPEKLYIRGGELWKLDPYFYCFSNVEVLRLRYLCKLHLKWLDCQLLFPNLTQLEVFECPNLVLFPCDDKGLWIRSEASY